MNKKLLFLSLAMVLSVLAVAEIKPAADVPVEKMLAIIKHADSLQKAKQISMDEANQYITERTQPFDLNQLNLTEINRIAADGMLYRYNSLRKLLKPALEKIMAQPTLEGCKAAAILTVNYPMAEAGEGKMAQQLQWTEQYKKFVTHPSIEAFIQENSQMSSSVFGRLQFLDPKAVGQSGLINDMLPLLKEPMSISCGSSAFILFKVAHDPETGLSKKEVQKVRVLTLKKTKETLANYKSQEKISERQLEHLEGLVAYLDGADSRGKLVDHKAPEIHFDWNTISDVALLSDLKEQIVVIDFWATWCGPCVASFPNVRELQKRYEGYPVTIIGVTSLQGSHTDQINKKRIITKDNPEQEYTLMKQFMSDMNMTWDVAFSEESQFNPEFGVKGIPHVAIIDAKGVVRYNRLRPYEAPWHEAEKIDALLKEAGLPYPTTPMEKTNYSQTGH